MVKEKTRTLLSIIMAVVFVISTALMLRQFCDNASGQDAYADAAAIAFGTESRGQRETAAQETTDPASKPLWVPAAVEDDPRMEEMAAIDLAALREVNEDVVGWIRIPDTKIDYPLMQGEDNDYYLNHTWERSSNSVGSIFLEYRNSPDLMDYNTIIYGHNMKNGSMFATLSRYSSEQYWELHPYVYITTDAGVYRYEVFSSYKANVDGVTYGLSFHQAKTKETFLLHILGNSSIHPEIVPGKNDRILTLSTCSGADYSTRWVVHARLKMVEVQQ